MFSASYPRGFPAGGSTASGFGRGNIVGFGRNQFMQSHRPPQMRHMFSPANNSSIMLLVVSQMSQCLYVKYVTSKDILLMPVGIGMVMPIFLHLNNLVEEK